MNRFRHAVFGIMLAAAGCAQGPPKVAGEVVAVNAGQKTVTLSHDAIPNIQMPAMTMVFNVNDPAMIGGLKAGDKVHFTADIVDGALVVTSIQP